MSTIDDDVLRGIVAKAIFETISVEDREKLLQGALQSLLEPQGDQWRKRPSQLADAFNNAAYVVANQLAKEMFTNDETVRTRLKQLMKDVLDKIFFNQDAYDTLASTMAQALREAFVLMRK